MHRVLSHIAILATIATASSDAQYHYGKPPCKMDEHKIVINAKYDPLEYCGRSCNTTSDCPTDCPPGTQSFPPHACVEASCGTNFSPTPAANVCVLHCHHEDLGTDPKCLPGSECLYLAGSPNGEEEAGICVYKGNTTLMLV